MDVYPIESEDLESEIAKIDAKYEEKKTETE